jgi:hypothetical protein
MAGDDWDELWNWAGPAANGIVREVYIGGEGSDGSDGSEGEDGSGEDDDEDDDDDDEDDEDEKVAPVKQAPPVLEQPSASKVVPLPLQSIMRYASLAGPLP